LTYHNIEELKELIAAKLTIDEIMDIMCLEIYELLEMLSEEVEEHKEEFELAIRDV
jgi:hypothetical protein